MTSFIKRGRLIHLSVIDPAAVRALQVIENKPVAFPADHGVLPGDAPTLNHEIAFRATADRENIAHVRPVATQLIDQRWFRQ